MKPQAAASHVRPQPRESDGADGTLRGSPAYMYICLFFETEPTAVLVVPPLTPTTVRNEALQGVVLGQTSKAEP
jgi:hypothetical protein